MADVKEELIRRVSKETDYFDVISITGTLDTGKTTLALNIFNDPIISYEFPFRIWLTISQDFSTKEIFLTILEKFTSLSDDIRTKNDHELARLTAAHLEIHKFLIVMDDVWSSGDWDALSKALPHSNNNGKVLITTRHEGVGKHASRPRPPFKLHYFRDKSWELTRKEAGKLEGHRDLKACLLYLGMFPEHYEIPVSKLIRLWIAEGFIQQNKHHSLEETAEEYLDDLINRKLVRAEKMKLNGKVKTCRVHGALRDFYRTEAAGNENQEIKYSTKEGFVPPIDDLHKYRRLSIHSNCLNFISSKPLGPKVCSFVCFSKDNYTLPSAQSSTIFKAFKLLRVLDVKPIKFPQIPSDMYKLVHVMRYLNFSSNLSILPSKFSSFHNLQTLIVNTTSPTLTVKADIWEMVQLRHFKTSATAILPKPSKDSKHGAKLQTLSTISVESCTPELFVRACNLKKLSIRGRLALLFQGKTGSLNSLGKLEKLKLKSNLYPILSSEDNLALPPPYQFPPGLRSLTLVATHLSWSNMSTLGLMENLEVLKLKDNAFIGRTWAVDRGFPRLKFLHIEHTNLAVWKASSHHFGKLRGLVLHNCEELAQIPIELAEIPSLQMLELMRCRYAAASARKIQEKKSKKHAQFKLSIFPPNE